MRSETDLAVVLRVRPYLEYDALITLIGQQEGRLTLLRKGLRRPRSRLSGVLRPFSVVAIEMHRPEGADRLASLLQAELRRPPLQADEPLLLLIAEVAEKLTRDGQRHSALFDLLASMPSMTHPRRATAAFILKTLTLLGFLPHYIRCPETKQKFTDDAIWQENGELVAKATGKPGPCFSFDEVKVLRFWQTVDLSLAEKVVVPDTTLHKIYTVLFDYLEREHGIVIKSRSLLAI